MSIAAERTTPTSPTMNPTPKTIDPSLPPWMRDLLEKRTDAASTVGGAFYVPRTRKTSSSAGNVHPKLHRQYSGSTLATTDSSKSGESLSQTPVAPTDTRVASSAKLAASRGGASHAVPAGSFPASHSVERRPDAVSSFSSSTSPSTASFASAQRRLRPTNKATTNVMGEESLGTPPASNAPKHSLVAEAPTVGTVTSNNTNTDDPGLAHCPGIVERLRSKFSNLNISTIDNYGLIADVHRDTGDWGSKPVRRVASLEDLLDRDDEDVFIVASKNQQKLPKTPQVPKVVPDPGYGKVEEPRQQKLFARNVPKGPSQANKYTQLRPIHNDALKKSRSMESLSSGIHDHVTGLRPKSIKKATKDEFDYMVIIERSGNRPVATKKPAHTEDNGKTRLPDLANLRLGMGGDTGHSGGTGGMGRWNSNADLDDELPRPDTVRNYKLMFESAAPIMMTLKQVARKYHEKYQDKQVTGEPMAVNGINANTVINNNSINANTNTNQIQNTFTITAKDKPKPPLPITQKPLLVKPTGLQRQMQQQQQPVTVKQESPAPVPKVIAVEEAAEDEVDITEAIRLNAKVPSASQPSSPSPVPTPQRVHSPQPPLINGVLKTTLKRLSDNDLLSAEEVDEAKMSESEMAKKPKVVSLHPKTEDQASNTAWKAKMHDFEGTVLPSTLHSVSNGVAAEKTETNVTGLKRKGGPLVARSGRGPQSAASTTLTFNFVGTDVVPKIANTTPRFSVQRPSAQKMSVNGVTEDAFDEFDETIDINGAPSGPCKYEFVGANVIIGRSSLLKKRNKQLRIAFDDRSTSTYEYPSELSMEQWLGQGGTDYENGPQIPEVPLNQPINDRPKLKSRPLGATTSGGLANYTPSSLNNDGEVFQLGISRPASAVPANQDQVDSAKEEPRSDSEDDVIIKPADEDENVTWSSAGTSDLLF